MSMVNAAYDLGGKWRADAEASPVFDIRKPGEGPPQKTRHKVPALSLHAVLSRDVGYFTHKDRILPDEAFERCFHFALAYGAEHHWKQRHDLTRAFCEGAFGLFLPMVWVQPPGPPAFNRRGDGHHDRWRFRLFMAPDWKMPIQPKILRHPPTYMRWEQYQNGRQDAA